MGFLVRTDGTGHGTVSIPAFPSGGVWEIKWRMQLDANQGSNRTYYLLGRIGAGIVSYINFRDGADPADSRVLLRVFNSTVTLNTPNIDWTTDSVYQLVANGSNIRFYKDGVQIGNAQNNTASFTDFNYLFRDNNSIAPAGMDLYYLEIYQNNSLVYNYQPSLSGGVGTTLTDAESGVNITLTGFTNNPWVEFFTIETVNGVSTPSDINFGVTVPFTVTTGFTPTTVLLEEGGKVLSVTPTPTGTPDEFEFTVSLPESGATLTGCPDLFSVMTMTATDGIDSPTFEGLTLQQPVGYINTVFQDPIIINELGLSFGWSLPVGNNDRLMREDLSNYTVDVNGNFTPQAAPEWIQTSYLFDGDGLKGFSVASSAAATGGGTYTPVPIPNLTETAVQGFARDDYHFYLTDSNFSGSVESLKKVTIQGIKVEENTSPYTSLPAGNWKTNDCCVYEGLIYVCLSDRDSDSRLLAKYNKSDLSYNTHADISAYFEFGAGICVGHTGNLFLVSFQSVSDINAGRVAEFTLDGTFVTYHSMGSEILEMQGITYDGNNYFISSSAQDLVYELTSSFNEIATYANTNSMTEIEGIEFYEGKYYTHDIQGIPFEFLERAYTPQVDTFPTSWQRIVSVTGSAPSGSLPDNVMLITEANLPAEIWGIAQNGGEDLRASLNDDGTSQLPLQVLEFDTVNNTAKILVRVNYGIGSNVVYLSYGTTGHTEQSPPNGSSGRNIVTNTRSLSMWDGTYDATSNGDTTSKQENTSNGFWVPSKGSVAPTGLDSVYFGDTQDTSWLEKTISNQQQYTMVVWYKAYGVDQSGNDIIATQEPDPSSNSSFLIDDASPNDIGSFIDGTGNGWMRSGVTRSIGNWQRIVLMVDNTTLTRKMWIDGTLAVSESFTTVESATRTVLRIAQRVDNSVNYQTYADMAGIELLNYAVSDDFAATDYNNQLNTNTFWTTGTPTDLNPVLQPPVANAGTDQTVNENTLVTLDGSGSTGTIDTYTWSQTAGTTVTLSDVNAVQPTFTAPDLTGNETLTFQLEVSNTAGSTTDIVNINVTDVIVPPVANAGIDQSVDAGEVTTLDGSGSTGSNLSYLWEQISGEPVSLSGATQIQPAFTAPSLPTPDQLVFRLTVTNGAGSNSDEVTIDVAAQVNPNNPPVANAGVDRNVAAGVLVRLDGSGSYDPDGNPITFGWTQTSGTPVTLSSITAEQPTFISPISESPVQLDFNLEVSDGTLTDDDQVTITVAANIPPPEPPEPTPTPRPIVEITIFLNTPSGVSR